MSSQTNTQAITRHFPVLLLPAALATLAVLFVHNALPAFAQQSANLTLSADAPTVAETAGSATVTVTLGQPAGEGGATVTLLPNPADAGTAALGRDYTLPGAFTIAAGDTTAEAEVVINDDAVNERDETINLTASLSSAAGVTVTGVTITIQDNEEYRDPPGSGAFSGLQPEDVRAAPKHGALTITFGRAVLSGLTFWLQWRADDNPEWTTVAPVSSGYTLSNLVDGILYHVRVTGDNGRHRGGWVSTSGRPRLQIELSVANGAVAETAGSITVTASLDHPAQTGVDVTLTPESGDPGTAALGRDYTLPGTFTIAAGDTAAEAEVIINDDAVNERDETISLTALSNKVGVVRGVAITIQDNEESRSPPGSGSFSGLQPENVRAAPRHEALNITFDRAVLSGLTFWLQWRADDNPEWTTVTPVTSGYTLGNLTNGVLYHVRITGDNGRHRGGWVSTSGTPAPGGL